MRLVKEIKGVNNMKHDNINCPACDGFMGLMGILDSMEWFQCEDCGYESGALPPYPDVNAIVAAMKTIY